MRSDALMCLDLRGERSGCSGDEVNALAQASCRIGLRVCVGGIKK